MVRTYENVSHAESEQLAMSGIDKGQCSRHPELVQLIFARNVKSSTHGTASVNGGKTSTERLRGDDT